MSELRSTADEKQNSLKGCHGPGAVMLDDLHLISASANHLELLGCDSVA
jgi:hypothetical protein